MQTLCGVEVNNRNVVVGGIGGGSGRLEHIRVRLYGLRWQKSAAVQGHPCNTGEETHPDTRGIVRRSHS